MAYYGIYSAGVAQTASDLADTVKFSFRSANALTANTVLGLDGSDIIYVGTQDRPPLLPQVSGSTELVFPVVTSTTRAWEPFPLLCMAVVAMSLTSDTKTGLFTAYTTGLDYNTGVDAIAVVTSQQAIRTLWQSQLYGNGGNDSIALGAQVTSLTGTTIGGGAGNDVIDTFNQISAGAAITTANAWQLAFTRIPSSKAAAVMTPLLSKAFVSASTCLPPLFREAKVTTKSTSPLMVRLRS